jgi:hypothetical protein
LNHEAETFLFVGGMCSCCGTRVFECQDKGRVIYTEIEKEREEREERGREREGEREGGI